MAKTRFYLRIVCRKKVKGYSFKRQPYNTIGGSLLGLPFFICTRQDYFVPLWHDCHLWRFY